MLGAAATSPPLGPSAFGGELGDRVAVPCLPPAPSPNRVGPPCQLCTVPVTACPRAPGPAESGIYQHKTLQPLVGFMGFPNHSKWKNAFPPCFPQKRERENEVGRDERLFFFLPKIGTSLQMKIIRLEGGDKVEVKIALPVLKTAPPVISRHPPSSGDRVPC